MSHKWDAALTGLVRDRKVSVARQKSIHLDEIRAKLLLLGDRLTCLCFICNRDTRTRPGSFGTVKDSTGKKHARGGPIGRSTPGAPLAGVGRPRHLSHTE